MMPYTNPVDSVSSRKVAKITFFTRGTSILICITKYSKTNLNAQKYILSGVFVRNLHFQNIRNNTMLFFERITPNVF